MLIKYKGYIITESKRTKDRGNGLKVKEKRKKEDSDWNRTFSKVLS